MSAEEPQRRMIPIGVMPSGYADVFLAPGSADPVSLMIADASAKLDREHAEAERIRLAAIADIERAKATRRARAAKRFRHALTALLRA
jgi:hypothetical protein